MMYEEIQRQLPKGDSFFNFHNKLFSFDSSTISLSLSVFDWAHYRTSKGGIKIHTLLDNDSCLPVFVHITEAREHDIKAARTLSLPKGSIVAMDRGYVDYALFYRWTQEGIFFVTRAKDNMDYEVVKELEVPNPEDTPPQSTPNQENGAENDEDAPKGAKKPSVPTQELNRSQRRILNKRARPASVVVRDQHIRLTGKKASADCPIVLRLVTAKDTTKNREFQFITNNFDLSAMTIADISCYRWEVELFF
jgi:hypothetical protein